MEKSKILQIYDLGKEFSDVRREQIILFLQKTNNVQSRPKTVRISIGVEEKESDIIKPQKEFEINYSWLKADKFQILDNPRTLPTFE